MKRDQYWDSLKFILIFLVVYVHCISKYSPSGSVNLALFNFLLTFLMPMFIFVSGMFSHIKDRNKYKLGILRIMETYIVFQVVIILLRGNITIRSIPSIIIYPQFMLWYLLCLVSWRLMVYFIPEKVIRNYPIWVILTCIFISLFGGFIPVGSVFSLQRTMTFLPFFFLGYYAKNIELKKHIAKIPSFLAFAILLSVFLIHFFILNRPLLFVFLGKTTYWSNVEFSPLLLCFFRCLFLLSATIVGVMVMRLVPTSPLLSRWGNITLFIYIYHSFAIGALRLAIKHDYFPPNMWILIILAVVITMGLVLLSHIKVLNILLNPISYFLKKKEQSCYLINKE